MIRTQIYLPKQLYNHIRVVAQKEQKSSAQIIRELLEKSLSLKVKGVNAGEALLKLAKIQAKGSRDLSTNVDRYLYGKWILL